MKTKTDQKGKPYSQNGCTRKEAYKCISILILTETKMVNFPGIKSSLVLPAKLNGSSLPQCRELALFYQCSFSLFPPYLTCIYPYVALL